MADSGPQDYPTTIGPDVSFKGELTFEKGLRLMGRFDHGGMLCQTQVVVCA